MVNEYKLMTMEEYSKVNPSYELGKYEDKYAPALVLKRGDEYTMLGGGHSEPEDANLWRDFNWVVGALNDAYNQGKSDCMYCHSCCQHPQ